MAKIKLDSKNYRVHPDKNKMIIDKSLKELGAGRSILIDSENEIIAGNGVFEQAEKQNIKIKIVETDGTELIAVKRTDLKTNDKKRKKLALIDNHSTDTSNFDFEVINVDFGEVELEEWGVDSSNINIDELGTEFSLPSGEKAPFQQMTFTLADEQAEQIKNAIADIKKTEEYKYAETMGNENSNGNALYLIVMQWAEQRK